MIGRIRKAINNVYDAWCAQDGRHYTLRIKGKVLRLDEWEYNPLAVGDDVEFIPYSQDEGLIIRRLARSSSVFSSSMFSPLLAETAMIL